jgi:hypothetical protein
MKWVNLIKRYYNDVKNHGLLHVVNLIYNSIYYRVSGKNSISATRLRLSQEIAEKFKYTVRYGPFSGFILPKKSWWGTRDRASMLLGLYEQEVLHYLSSLSGYNTFVDLGAADGYYSVGVVKSKMFQYSYSFEISNAGQCVIRDTAKENDVSDQVKVFGRANSDFYKKIHNYDDGTCVILVDVEGFEFSLFDDRVFSDLKRSIIIIEIHAHLVSDGDKKLDQLVSLASSYFSVDWIHTSSRDLSCYSDLDCYNDDERWLICSEGRGHPGSWLLLKPKNNCTLI